MKVIVMGAGGQGAPCASILARDESVEKIKLCDINLPLMEKVKERIKSDKLVIEKVDASDVKNIANAMGGYDVVIDLLTERLFFNVYQAALSEGLHYVNTAWSEALYEEFDENDTESGKLTPDSKLKLSDEFAAKNLTAILGCGMTSGYTTNVLIRYYADKMDTVESVRIRLAKKDTGIPDGLEILHPWNPGWDPKTALLDFVEPTLKFEDGKFVRMSEPFAEPEMWDFPAPIGKTLVTHHAHEEPFCVPMYLKDKGLRHCDFKYYANQQIAPIVALGLGSDEEIEIKGVKIAPLDVVIHHVKKPGDAFLNENPANFEVADKNQFVSIMTEMIGTKDGKKIKYMLTVMNPVAPRQHMYDTYGTSMINVSLPAVIGAKMAFEGTKKGTISPHEMDPNRFIELLRKSGYQNKWDEKMETIG